MSKIKIGWGEEKFVFPKPVSLRGQFAKRISQYEEKPLTATALAIEDDKGEQMIFCSVDLVSVSYVFMDEIRKRLEDNILGIIPEKVIVSAIHTHTGPSYAGADLNSITRDSVTAQELLVSMLPKDRQYIEKVNVDHNDDIMSEEEVLEEVASKTVCAIIAAWKNRKEGGFSNAFGRAAVGMCRRVSYSDGTSQMWGDTNCAVFTELEGGNDSGIELMYMFDSDEKLTGIVANLACPAQCVQHRLFISPDFWGEVKMLLRQHFGEEIFLLTLCSAAGDQCPVDLIRWVEPESDLNDPNLKRNNPLKRKADPSMFDLDGMRKVGKRIANEIIDVFACGLDAPQSNVDFTHQVHNMQLPLRRATLEEGIVARREIQNYLQNTTGDVDFNDLAKLEIHLGILCRLELQEKLEIVDTEVHIIRLGSIAIATNPFELFLDYGNQIKARSFAEQTFIVQLACASEWYLPTEKAEKGGHYSAFIPTGSVGHAGGEQLVRETLHHINKMFS